MDIFEFPEGYKPEKHLTSQQMQEIEQYLKNHPLFMNQLPKDIESNQHLRALMELKEDEDPNQIAQNLNKQANKKLKQNPNGVYHMKQAYQKYTEAINLKCSNPTINAKLHANRAQLNLKLKNYGKVIIDCKQCLKYDSEYIKGYYRYGKALIALEKYQQCIKILESRNEQQLKQLFEEAKNKIDKQKQKQSNKKNEKEDKMNSIKKYCQEKGWKYTKRNQTLPEGAKTQIIDGKLSIPLIIYYPEFSQFDLVASSYQDHHIIQHLTQIITKGLPWDSKHQYQMDSIEIYCELAEAVLVKIPKQTTIGEILVKVPFKEALELQVVRKDNVFYHSYIHQHKIR